ncbi:uncharacterized protein V6R79_000016 [Siganus canaliculatus]
MLLLSVVRAQHAPDSTQALLLTEGSISTVQPASLSVLSNITVIGLSHNQIVELNERSFRALPFLHTLLLDHNLLTSQALQGGALSNLTQLEVLALGHNLISMIRGVWLEGSRALRSLKLEGNLLTSLDSASLPQKDLRDLESLDLSDNLIQHLDRNSFAGLVRLQTLDLSRNRLRSAPSEAFSYLNWLTNLNLDLNSWNCTCQLLELAAFLSTFLQQPDKTLYNGRRMVCVSADNPAVTTVLELTEANCVPSNQNITVQIESTGSVTPQLYARDLAITAVICFVGGVGLTLLIVLIYYQVSLRKKRKESKRHRAEEEEGRSTTANHINVSEKKNDLFLQTTSNQPWDRDGLTLEAGIDHRGHQLRDGVDDNSRYFHCPDCSSAGQRAMELNLMRWSNRTNSGMESEELKKRGVRMMTEEERRMVGNQQQFLNRDFPDKFLPHGNRTSSSHFYKDSFSQREEMLSGYRETGESYRTDLQGRRKGHETLQCQSCHRMSRPPEPNTRQGRMLPNVKDSLMSNGFPSQYRQIDRGRNVNHNQWDMMKNMELRRETRNVTFDLERSRSHGKSRGKEEDRTGRDKGRERHQTHKSKVQSSPLLKVKLNLNPLRKSKVHPKRKTEQGHSEKRSSRKSKDKRQNGKEKGEGKGKRKSDETKTKGNKEEVTKSTKTKGSTAEEKKEDTEEKQKGSSKVEPGGQGSTEDAQEGNKLTEHSSDITNTAEQPASANATTHQKDLPDGRIQYQGTGSVPPSAQVSSQLPLSLSASDRNHSTNLALLGSAASQLTGHGLSLQTGNVLLNATTTGSKMLFPSYSGNCVSPSIAISGPSTAPGGAPDSFQGHAVIDLNAPLTSLIANTTHAQPLQASSLTSSSLHASEPAVVSMGVTANPALNPGPVQPVLWQSQVPSEYSPLTAQRKPNPVQGTGLQASKEEEQLPAESRILQVEESPTIQAQAPANAQDYSALVTTVENVSNNNSQTEAGRAPAGSVVHMAAGDSLQVAEASVPGVSTPSASTQSLSIAGDGAASGAGLVQQEYVSEEGGSSPRRKLRLVLPEKTSSRPPTALERKLR